MNIAKECEVAYNSGRGGNVQAVIDTASKKGHTHMEYCAGCEADMPMKKGKVLVDGIKVTTYDCLVCGQSASGQDS